jgi:hypothetical protein
MSVVTDKVIEAAFDAIDNSDEDEEDEEA